MGLSQTMKATSHEFRVAMINHGAARLRHQRLNAYPSLMTSKDAGYDLS